MWHLKDTTMPIIVGAQGMIKKKPDKHIDKIPGSPIQYKIQKKYFLQNCSSP